jgi:hypothetical protein
MFTAPCAFNAPDGAHDLEMWFENTSYRGCAAWDSVHGQNYHSTLQ